MDQYDINSSIVKFKKTFKQVLQNNDYYSCLFEKSKIDIDSILSYDDFMKIPILEKNVYRENVARFEKTIKDVKHITLHTSGSTGMPVKIYRAKSDQFSQNVVLCNYRNKNCTGISNKKLLYIHFMRYDKKEYLIENHSGKCIHFAYSEINNDVLDQMLVLIDSYQPEWLVGNTSAIFFLAKHMVNKGVSEIKSLEYIECISEYLTDEQRGSIYNAFNLIPFNAYGSNEANTIALECKNKKMHILKESVFVEIINQDENGVGEVVITTLLNTHTPFLRYKQGDLAYWGEKCTCGFNAPVLCLTGYRNNDYIKRKNGSKIEVWHLNNIFREMQQEINFAIAEYQFIQLSYEIFSLEIIFSRIDNNKKFELLLNKKFSRLYNDKFTIEFKYSEKINIDKNSGKFKYFQSHL